MKDTLVKYAADLKARLESPVPPKHSNRPDAFRQFLKREIQSVILKIEDVKLEGFKK